jgi:predicted transcriptional regulator
MGEISFIPYQMPANSDQGAVEKMASEITEGVYQSYLVSSTGLDSQIISKICEELETEGLIIRKETVRSEERTYRIKPNKGVDYETIKELISKYFSNER